MGVKMKFDSLKALEELEELIKALSKKHSLTTHVIQVKKITDFLEKIHDAGIATGIEIGFEQGEKSNHLKL